MSQGWSLAAIVVDELEKEGLALPGASDSMNDNSVDMAEEVAKLTELHREHQLAQAQGLATSHLLSLCVKAVPHVIAQPPARQYFLGLQQNEVQVVLDLLQEWLDWASWEHPDRRQVLYLLVNLSITSKQFPRALYASDVTLRGPWLPVRHGGFADIYKADKDGKAVALKRLRVHLSEHSDREDLDQRFRREALVWRQLHHRYILPFIGLDEHTFREGDFLPCMVSPWMPRGTLREYVASDDYIPSRDLHRVLSEAAEGLVYLHLQKFVHGDLNQVNILVGDDLHVQLCDFGLVIVGDKTKGRLPTTSRGLGTKTWMSPQRLRGSGGYRRTPADDVYAFACLCYYLCTKPARVPFESLGEWEALFQIVTGSRPARPIGEDAAGDGLITDALWDMVESCWDQDPAKRPSISDVLAQLSQL